MNAQEEHFDIGPFVPSSDDIVKILRSSKTIAVVGMSQDPHRPSKRVGMYLKKYGYDIIPVNPRYEVIMNIPTYSDLTSVPVSIDVVDVFLNPIRLGPIVDEAIAVGAKVLWLQEGVVDEVLARKAQDAGLIVVMDRCIMKEHLAHIR